MHARRRRRWLLPAPVGLLLSTLLLGAPSAPAGAQSTLSFTETWSAGPLDDQGAPIAESSPMVATLDGSGPAVVVGDRAGRLYAYHLSDGSAVAGWPTGGGEPIDSTPSVAPIGPGALDDVYVGTGNAADPNVGGYRAWSPDGASLWATAVSDPSSDATPAAGVQASMTVAQLDGRTAVVAGSLDQEQYALDAADGSTLPGWPFFTADSVFSTAAVADLYGTGRNELVEGGAQTAGFALGRNYRQGGHLRILNPRGGLVCEALTDQTVDSSPAVGPLLAGGAPGIAVGTGAYFAGAADTDAVKAYDTSCRPVWSRTLDGSTTSSPAIADVSGDGRPDVVEGTDNGTTGSVWALEGSSGAVAWSSPVIGRVIGSVVAADLTGQGYEDVLVPTTAGLEVLDGRSGAEVAVVGQFTGLQNAPLVTADPNGAIGITLAGYNGTNRGVVEHFEVTGGGSGPAAVGGGSWPMFHHDPQLTGVYGGAVHASVAACSVPDGARPGYDLVASDGGVFADGQAYCGSTGGTRLAAPVVGAATAPGAGGYWLAASDGGVFAFGESAFFGSMGGTRLAAPIVGMAATPDGGGYWLVASDGGIFAFGDATFFGSMGGTRLAAPIVGMAASPDGEGYRLVASDGGIFAFGDAQYFGSMGAKHLDAPVVGMADDPATAGYWLVGSDGGIFAFGAPFYGSAGGLALQGRVVGIAATLDGYGYRMVGSDGGVFCFGDAPFFGSAGSRPLDAPIVAIAGS